MNDELKEIHKIPEFVCDIDPRTLAEIKTEESRNMAIYLNKENQRNRWIQAIALEGYNMGVRSTNFRRKYGPIIVFVVWVGSLLIGAFASKLGGLIWK